MVNTVPGRDRTLRTQGEWVLSLTLVSAIAIPIVVIPAIVIPLRLGLNPEAGRDFIESYRMSLCSVLVLPFEYAGIAVVASVASVLGQRYTGLKAPLYAIVGAVTGSVLCPVLVVNRLPSFAPATWPLAICGALGGLVYGLILFCVTKFLVTRSIHREAKAAGEQSAEPSDGAGPQ